MAYPHDRQPHRRNGSLDKRLVDKKLWRRLFAVSPELETLGKGYRRVHLQDGKDVERSGRVVVGTFAEREKDQGRRQEDHRPEDDRQASSAERMVPGRKHTVLGRKYRRISLPDIHPETDQAETNRPQDVTGTDQDDGEGEMQKETEKGVNHE